MRSLDGGRRQRPARNAVTRLSGVAKRLFIGDTTKQRTKKDSQEGSASKRKLDQRVCAAAKKVPQNVRPRNTRSAQKQLENGVGRATRRSLQRELENDLPTKKRGLTIKRSQNVKKAKLSLENKPKDVQQSISSYKKEVKTRAKTDAQVANSLSPSMQPSERLNDYEQRERHCSPAEQVTTEKETTPRQTLQTGLLDSSVSSADCSPHIDRRLDSLSISTKVFYSTPKSTPNTPSKKVRVGLACTTPRGRRQRSSQTRVIKKGVHHGIKRKPRTLADVVQPSKSSNDVDRVLSGLRNERLRNLILSKREQNTQIEKVHSLFRRSKNPIEMARPLTALGPSADDSNNNLKGTPVTQTCQTDLVEADFSDIECDNEVSACHANSPLATSQIDQGGIIIPLITSHIIQLPTDSSPIQSDDVPAIKRKFFKSGSARGRKEVQITGNIRASLCQGKMSLLQQKKPRRKSRSRKPLNKFSDEQATIDKILQDLDDNISSSEPDATTSDDRLCETLSNNLCDNQQSELNNGTLPNGRQSEIDTVILDDDNADDNETLAGDQQSIVEDTVVLDDEDDELSEVETIVLDDDSSDLETILLSEEEDEGESNSDSEVMVSQDTICNDEFRQRLPYNTTNPELIYEQQAWLDFLVNNNILNEETFTIFIADPDNHKEEAKLIFDEVTLPREESSDNESVILLDEHGQSDENVQLSETSDDDTPVEVLRENEKFRQRLPYNTTDPELIRQQHTLLDFLINNNILNEETFTIFIADPDNHTDEANRIVDEVILLGEQEERESTNSALSEDESGFLEDTLSVPSVDSVQLIPTEHIEGTSPNRIEVISDEIIDVPMFHGYQPLVNQSTRHVQPSSVQCKYCGLVYSMHEPKEEQLHREYHASMHVLRFKGWIDEDIVAIFTEWSADGRILRLNNTSQIKRRERLMDILKIVDQELGFPTLVLPKIYVAYLAVRKQHVVGLCLVQPLEKAHKYICINGMDCHTQEMFDAKCGITRLWVSPLHRRLRIASKLIEAVRFNTIPGKVIPMNHIAFSSPTEVGKIFARKVTQIANFLVYQ